MAKPRRFKWRGPADNYEPKERVGRDLFDAALPLGDIPKEKKTAAAGPRVILPSKPLGCECGRGEFIQLGARWVCVNCNPQYKPQQRTAAREIVTIPASLANDAAELRKAWELIQQKRAAAGLAPLAEICEPRNEWAEVRKAYDAMQTQRAATGHCLAPDFDRLISFSTIEDIKNIISASRIEPGELEASKWPASVAFYSHMGIAAARRYSKLGGGWRLYVMAKALDPQGLGMIAREDLRDYALFLGVEVRTFERWIKQARNAGLFIDVQSSGGAWMLRMVNAGQAAAELNCETVGRKVTLPAAALIGNGWKARVWAAYEITHNGQPIARETMQKIVNVAVSTQRYRDAQAKVNRVRNFAKSDIQLKGNQLPGLKETSGRKNIFIDKDGFINWRLPNSYIFTKALRGGKGRGRKANKIIRNIQPVDSLLLLQQALRQEDEYNPDIVKLFNQNPQQAKRAMKKLAKIDNRKVKDIYERSHKSHNGAVIWAHLPVSIPAMVTL